MTRTKATKAKATKAKATKAEAAWEAATRAEDAREPRAKAAGAARTTKPAGGERAGSGPRGRSGRVPPDTADAPRRTAAALAVVAALFAAWSGWSWYSAAEDDSLRYSHERDEVLQSGEQAIQNLYTLDYRDLGPGLKRWQDSTTADLYRQIVQGRADFEKKVREAKTITSARILEGGVGELDLRAGKASVIVAVQITVTPPEGEPVTKQNRLAGRLDRTGAGWKVSALGQAPMGTT